MAEIVAFNEVNAGRALRFGQDLFLAAERDQARSRSEARATSRARSPPCSAAKTCGMVNADTGTSTSSMLCCSLQYRCCDRPPRRAIRSVMVPGGFYLRDSDAGSMLTSIRLGVTSAGGAARQKPRRSGARLRAGVRHAQAATWLARPLTPHCDRPRVRGNVWKCYRPGACSVPMLAERSAEYGLGSARSWQRPVVLRASSPSPGLACFALHEDVTTKKGSYHIGTVQACKDQRGEGVTGCNRPVTMTTPTAGTRRRV